MNEKPQLPNISLSAFKNYFSGSPFIGLDDDFFIIDVSLNEAHRILSHPCRFDAMMMIYCVSGHIKLNVNLEEYELGDDMLFLNFPGNLIRVNEFVDTKQEDIHYICMMMSRDFVNNLLLDVNKVFVKNLQLIRNPCIKLTEKDRELLCSHVNLMISLIKSCDKYKNETVKSLVTSVFYFLADAWTSGAEAQSAIVHGVSSRNRAMFEQFIRLVSEYHTMHRNVGFYSDQLSLTPKYLSRLIREASGKSAPEWIDAYVILEAKNLLKYSSIPIKDIVAKLNFPNQSVFYKFFKARTGMTPSEYRNS